MSSYRNAPLSTGQDFRDLSLPLSLYRGIRHVSRHYIPNLLTSAQGAKQQFTRLRRGEWQWRSFLSLPTTLILIWILALWWGEVRTFRTCIDRCDWQTWERWPESASPHHMVLVADPQLVDPHTYPGRPWPLSTVTRYHTDYYMRKSFTLVQNHLDPTSVFFLGDLFDGGREWMPSGTASSDPRWSRYGEDFWVKEYKRFGSIFFNEWLRRGSEGYHADIHRKLSASLPGNHDLGLGNGIRIPVRKRFNAFVGEGSRIDVIGNHTFVSLDTVSLSAKGQPDPATGRQGATDGDGLNREIWGPVDEFLANIKETKTRTIGRAIRLQNSRIENSLLFHEVLDIQDPLITKSVHTAYTPKADLPSIVLTHVPLYRAAGIPCGPLRERLPPSTKPSEDGEYLQNDPQNAIKVEAGVQYQNVLTPEISNEIIDKVGDVEFVFSGDDHDYCEVVHRRYTSRRGGIREITVKSFSWAMGVRKPGFLMLSLWNPLDKQDRSTSHFTKDSKHDSNPKQQHPTIQTHLCLLPDQLAIFIRYAILLFITLLSLFIHAVRTTKHHTGSSTLTNSNILPLTSKHKSDTPPPSPQRASKNLSQSGGLAVRSTANRTRSASPKAGYRYPGTTSSINADSLHDDPLDERWGRPSADDRDVWNEVSIGDSDSSKRKAGVVPRIRAVGREFRRTVLIVGIPVVAWYFYLVRKF